MRSRAKSMALAAALLLAGCGGGVTEPKGPIPMGQIPAPVVRAAQKDLPDVAFDAAFREKIKGESFYEIRGKGKDGKTRSIELSQQGKVLKVQ